jgi:L-ascorbate metabolism protein UlaG (beta-lactamase superfamily)
MFTFRALALLALLGLIAGSMGRISPAAGAAAADGITITFLANEGVLLSGTDAARPRKVLIDALVEPYETFAIPAESTQVALRQAHTPFDSVDLVLVTHRHGDHFHPAPAAAHLRANPRAVLVTSQQVIDSMRGRVSPELLRDRRVAARSTPPGSRRSLLVNGIPVQLLGLPHSGGRRHRQVEHVAYLIDLGGRRILHVGDAELSEATLAPLRLDTMQVDIALLPWWTLTDADALRAIERWIRPRRVAAFHLAGNDAATARKVRAAMPAAHVFVRTLETVLW